ncbi:uncharacterized protein LOC103151946 isoform X3 [Poecilia formosa]|uniref:uncharacterized protein LOC103151946 isoform X3 n=1 Tax=Poecilia formosa TaxID=48698 RepID=UPI0007B853B0|nr:PREDICTED: uncharacterized protein LOC103151946 isoform X3 [Poecilia formosa]
MRTMKKMASLLNVCVFLLCCSAVASQGCDHLVAVGGNFIVPLGYKLKPADKLKWRFNGNIIVFKRPEKFIVGKTDDINDDGSLKLTNLKKDQAGLYTAEVFDKNGKEQATKRTNLCTLDPVKKPTVNITCLASEVVFTCSHDPQPDGTKQYDAIYYKWFYYDKMISNGTETSMTRKAAETENLLVSCEVGNKVSSAKSDSLTHTCNVKPLKKPEIQGTCKDSEVIITCHAPPLPDNVQFKWFQDGEVIVNETEKSLTINSAGSKNKNFSCEVYNQASSKKSDSFSHSCVGSNEAELEYRAGNSSSPEYCTH